MTPKTLLTGKMQSIVFEKKQNGRQLEKQKDITHQAKDSKTFTSTNSFGPLAVDVDFDSHLGSDIQTNPKNCIFLDNEIGVPLVLTANDPVRKNTLRTSNRQSKNSRSNGKKNKKQQNVSKELKLQSKSQKCQSTTHFSYISVVLNYVRKLLNQVTYQLFHSLK